MPLKIIVKSIKRHNDIKTLTVVRLAIELMCVAYC